MASYRSWRAGTYPQTGAFTIIVDEKPIFTFPGETLSAALYAAGIHAWRRSRQGEPRGLLCGMGICYECLVTVNGKPGQRACQVEVRPGMIVNTDLQEEMDD
jgi:predicted molibdopterin-dependent oxidoreductase YjgC